ncbi:MAG TPA: TetR family transcriptional regulator [Thermoanaerobaculia bacterium]|nr:TetR family transcriptional regulator [Thermoanaerobaculia bacterium]
MSSRKLSTPKAEETRRRILQAALGLFQEKGFAETTIREIAREASVATGAAYYYFPSKEAIVMAFYAQTQEEMQELTRKPMAEESDLRARLKAILDLKFEQLRPYQKALGAVFASAADPASPISPFGDQTQAIRDQSIRIFREALEGSDVKVPSDLADHLPRLLWLYHMGLVLFWIHDRSPRQKRTERLMNRSLDLIVRLLRVSRFRILAPLRKAGVELLRSVEE